MCVGHACVSCLASIELANPSIRHIRTRRAGAGLARDLIEHDGVAGSTQRRWLSTLRAVASAPPIVVNNESSCAVASYSPVARPRDTRRTLCSALCGLLLKCPNREHRQRQCDRRVFFSFFGGRCKYIHRRSVERRIRVCIRALSMNTRCLC